MTANQPVPPKLPITGVKHLIAVGSGKRVSARPQFSVNLGVALASLGA